MKLYLALSSAVALAAAMGDSCDDVVYVDIYSSPKPPMCAAAMKEGMEDGSFDKDDYTRCSAGDCGAVFKAGGSWEEFMQCTQKEDSHAGSFVGCNEKATKETLPATCDEPGAHGTYLKVSYLGDPSCSATKWCIPDEVCGEHNNGTMVCSDQNDNCPAWGIFHPEGWASTQQSCILEIAEYNLQNCEQAFSASECGTDMAIPRTCSHPSEPDMPRFFLAQGSTGGNYFFDTVDACKAEETKFMSIDYTPATTVNETTGEVIYSDTWIDSAPGVCQKDAGGADNANSLFLETNLGGLHKGMATAAAANGWTKENFVNSYKEGLTVVRCCVYEGDVDDPKNPPVCRSARRMQIEANSAGKRLKARGPRSLF